MKKFITILLLVALGALIGCSTGNGDPINLNNPSPKDSNTSHQLWGLWQFIADPAKGTLDVIPLRSPDFHINALPFLEPPPLVNLTLETLKFTGNIIDADIGLRHPFLGLNEFTGFDVCGIFITNGTVTGFNDTGLRMAGEGDTRLLNPDGYSRWWNPAEFPIGKTMFNYKDGLLGAPDSYADYNSTLNAYKYYCNDFVNPNDPMTVVNLAKRGMFSAGQKNIRHYKIELGTEGLIFNYAVDASWEFPKGSAPWVAPDDFGPGANRPEPWNIIVDEKINSLWNDGTDKGGDLKLSIDVYDWFNAGMNTVRVESPSNFPMVESAAPIGGGEGYSTYEIEILDATPAPTEIKLLISVISEEENFGGFLTGVNTTAYFTHSADVSPESPSTDKFKNIPLLPDVKPFDITFDPIDGKVLIIYDNEEVWKYLPSDDYQVPNPNAKYYDTEWHLYKPTAGTPAPNATSAFVDVADNQYFIVDYSWYTTTQVNRAWYDVVDNTGVLVKHLIPIGTYFGCSYPNYEGMAYGTGGSDTAYHNRMACVWGHSLPYWTLYNWSVPTDGYTTTPYIYKDFGWSSGPQYGKGNVYGVYVRGAEVDKDDLHVWYLETNDYYCARFTDITFDNAFCGTGAQTDDDTGFNNPKDLTRDVNNDLIALDILSDDTSRLKAFDPTGSTDTVPAASLGGFTLDDIIIGPALRIDCSDYVHPTYGNPLVVMHGSISDGYYMSFFFPDELPW
jgi:hypothetical protein